MPRHRINDLKYQATQSARFRKHRLGEFADNRRDNRVVSAIAECQNCTGYVQVIVSPAPNEIEVGGPVVATNCVGV